MNDSTQSASPKLPKAVADAIKAFQAEPQLRRLAGNNWRMFGRVRLCRPDTELMDLLVPCVSSKNEARRIIQAKEANRFDLDERHFILSTSRGNRIFGLFRVSQSEAA